MKYTYFLVILSLLLVGCTTNTPTTVPQTVPQENVPTTPTVQTTPTITATASGYAGQILAGDKTPYLTFNAEDYAKATSSGKVILLYFYSDVGPLSKSDEYKLYKAFDGMTNTNMIGFKVHYGDDATTDTEKQLASTLGVKESRTKVILKNGVVKQRSTAVWDISTYAAQMTLYLD
jgi:hypothetical protein